MPESSSSSRPLDFKLHFILSVEGMATAALNCGINPRLNKATLIVKKNFILFVLILWPQKSVFPCICFLRTALSSYACALLRKLC